MRLRFVCFLIVCLASLSYSGGKVSSSKYIEASKVQLILDKAEYSTKKMRELKVDPVGSPLVKSYEMFVALLETKDSSLIDSVRLSRRAFFERWKQESDSICGTVGASDSMAFEIRSIYEAALRLDIEEEYDFELKKRDSLHYEERKDVSFENKVEYLRANINKGLMARFFAVENQVAYLVTPAKTLEELTTIVHSRSPFYGGENRKVSNMACMEKNPMGQEVLVLTEKYSFLLDAFMGVSREHESWFPPHKESWLKRTFLESAISVAGKHWGNGYHYESFPSIMSVVFNENRTLAILNVMSSYCTGGNFTLVKNAGIWKAVKSNASFIL